MAVSALHSNVMSKFSYCTSPRLFQSRATKQSQQEERSSNLCALLLMPPLLTFQLLLLLLSSVLGEDSSCPCLTSDNGALDLYKTGGQLFYNEIPYPNDYGNEHVYCAYVTHFISWMHQMLRNRLLVDFLFYILIVFYCLRNGWLQRL